jgi:hypothetical protein
MGVPHVSDVAGPAQRTTDDATVHTHVVNHDVRGPVERHADAHPKES